jgi:hypothetical protein
MYNVFYSVGLVIFLKKETHRMRVYISLGFFFTAFLDNPNEKLI